MDLEYSLGDGWYKLLEPIFATRWMTRIGQRLYERQDKLRPALYQVFDAFRLCQPKDVKVIIVGQDPYPHRHANGLAFSTTEPDLPLTLRIAFKAMAEQGFGTRHTGDLTDWARQGVLLTNTVLTCEEGHSLAHNHWGWQQFIAEALMKFSIAFHQPYVVMIWGRHAREMIRNNLIWQSSNVQTFETCHPVAESYAEGKIKFVPHFKEANEWLVSKGQRPIIWNPLKTSEDDLFRRDALGTTEPYPDLLPNQLS